MSKTLWRQFGILCAIAVVFSVGGSMLGLHSRAPERISWSSAAIAALLNAPGTIVLYVALAAAIAAGTARIGSRSIASAVWVAIIATVLMIADDLWISPSATREYHQLARTRAATWPFEADTAIYAATDTLGMIRAAVKLLKERPPALQEKLGASWSSNHPRATATKVAIALPHFLLPFTLVGILIGCATWLRRRVMFRAPRDETIARWCSAWLVGSAAWTMMLGWPNNYLILHHFRPYWWPLFLYLPFVAVAALGWRSAMQSDEPDSDVRMIGDAAING